MLSHSLSQFPLLSNEFDLWDLIRWRKWKMELKNKSNPAMVEPKVNCGPAFQAQRHTAAWNRPLTKALDTPCSSLVQSPIVCLHCTLEWEEVLFHYQRSSFSSCDRHIKLVLMKHRDEESESRFEIMFIDPQRDYYEARKNQFKTRWKEPSFHLTCNL